MKASPLVRESPENRESIVLKIIVDELDVAPEQLQESTSLVEDLGADSLALMNIVMNIEERFKIDVPEIEWRTLLTVGDVLSYVRRIAGTVST